MPVMSAVKSTKLVLIMDDGLSPGGSMKVKRATYSNVKSTAADSGVHQAAQALASLSQYPLVGVERGTVSQIYN